MMKTAIDEKIRLTGSNMRIRRIIRWLALFSILMVVPAFQGPALAQETGSTMPSISEEPIDRAQVHYERAQLLESWEMWEKALEEYRNTLEITDFGPHRAGSHYGMAYCLYKLGRYQEALDSLKQIEAEDMPDSSMKDRIENARRTILKAASEHSPKDPKRP